jgi:hypothetical protein
MGHEPYEPRHFDQWNGRIGLSSTNAQRSSESASLGAKLRDGSASTSLAAAIAKDADASGINPESERLALPFTNP